MYLHVGLSTSFPRAPSIVMPLIKDMQDKGDQGQESAGSAYYDLACVHAVTLATFDLL